MLVGSRRFAAVQLDACSDLIRICGSIAKRGVQVRTRKGRIREKLGERIGLRGQVVYPHRHLPYVGAAEQSRASPGWAVAKGDERMLLPAGAFLGVAAKSIRQRLAGGARS